MSATYDFKNNLIFTGGHDGTILAWHFETGFIKFYLHTQDPTCTSDKHILEAKSVDCLFIMQKERILISGTADQTLRFWDLVDLQSSKYLLGHMKVNHAQGDALTQITVNSDCTRFVTADTAGRLKLWDISKVDFRKDGKDGSDMSTKMREIWFIQAHKSTVNTLSIVETFKDNPHSDTFVLSCSNDKNILLHRLSNGQKVGQFGQSTWNINDMSTVRRRPNYVHEWFLERKNVWKKFVNERLKEAKAKGLIDAFFKLPKSSAKEELKKIGFVNSEGEGSLSDPNSDDLGGIDPDEFNSDDDDDKKFKGKKLTSQFKRETKPDQKNGEGMSRYNVDLTGYQDRVLRHQTEFDKYKQLDQKYRFYKPEQIRVRFDQEKNKQ